MNHWKKPLLVNAITLVVVLVVSLLVSPFPYQLVDHAFAVSFAMIFLAPVNLVVGMVRNRNKRPDGPAYIILAGLLLLIGFSVCTVSFAKEFK